MLVRTEANSQPDIAAMSARWAGFSLLATGGLSIALFLMEEASTGAWQVLYWALTITLVASGALVTVMGNALRKHYEAGKFGLVGVILAGIGTVAGMIAWAFPLWGLPLGIASMIFASILLNEGTAPKTPVTLFGFSMIAGLLTFFLLDALEVGTVSPDGDYPVAINTALLIMLFGTGIGLIGIGGWLRAD